MLHRLQYISQGSTPEAHLKNIAALLDAGVKFVQLRLKDVATDIYQEYAARTVELCRNFDAVLIINDNVEVALKCSADGVHLGLEDMPVAEARKLLGPKIIGGTANTFKHILKRNTENVDYIGLGPYRFTTTKQKLSPVLGLEGYRNIISDMMAEGLSTPLFAIGGIELADVAGLRKEGVYGVAISGALTKSTAKEKLVKQINNILNAQDSR